MEGGYHGDAPWGRRQKSRSLPQDGCYASLLPTLALKARRSSTTERGATAPPDKKIDRRGGYPSGHPWTPRGIDRGEYHMEEHHMDTTIELVEHLFFFNGSRTEAREWRAPNRSAHEASSQPPAVSEPRPSPTQPCMHAMMHAAGANWPPKRINLFYFIL